MSTAPETPMIAAPAAPAGKVPLKTIIAIVAREMGLRPADLCAQDRHANMARARQLAMWFARRYTSSSLTRIGRELRRDHTTVLHGTRVIDKQLRTDRRLRRSRDRIRARLAAWAPGEPIMVAAPAMIVPAVVPEESAKPWTPAPDDMPVEFYTRERQKPVITAQRDYLRAQDEAFCAAMRAAGYVEEPAPQGGGQ